MNEDQEIPEDTRFSIEQLIESNVEVVIATGRAPYHLKPIAEELGIDSYISFNGAHVVYHGEVIDTHPIHPQAVETMKELAHKFDHPLVYLGDRGYFASHENHADVIKTFHELKIDAPSFDPHFGKEQPIYQLMLYCDSQEEK